MDNADAGGWCYTARYGWNWRSARAISSALGSLALPMPPWFRAVVARSLLTRTALHADAQGICGSVGPLSPGLADPCPWKDVTNIVVWDYGYLRIIGLARRADIKTPADQSYVGDKLPPLITQATGSRPR